MAITFLHDGQPSIPSGMDQLNHFVSAKNLDLVLEWLNGQYWLHSDLKGERPIGVLLDEELERHVNYFKKSSLHREVLARSIGIKGAHRPKVLDLTAGLLGDTLLFLSMGCEVIAVERHPIIAFLIQSALKNAKHPLLSKLTFMHKEALDVLNEGHGVDVIFYDPMFEDPNQKSSPRKEMRIFRSLIGEDQDTQKVMERALSLNVRRVVVKRPRLSATVISKTPLQYSGKATRYDVYLSQNHGPNESNHIE